MEMFKWFKNKNKEEVDEIDFENDDIYVDEDIKTYTPEKTVTGVKEVKPASYKSTEARFSPKDFNDMKDSAEALLLNGRITISLKNMSEQDRKRSINFLSGVIFALSGTVEKIENNVYQFTVNK